MNIENYGYFKTVSVYTKHTGYNTDIPVSSRLSDTRYNYCGNPITVIYVHHWQENDSTEKTES